MNKRKLTLYLSLMILMTSVTQGGSLTVYAALTSDSQPSVNLSKVEANSANSAVLPAEPEPSVSPTVMITPKPAMTLTPTVTPTPGTPSTPSITPTPSKKPTLAPSKEPTPTPTEVPYRSRTLEKMASYDYVNKSVTGISKKILSLSVLQQKINAYGTLHGSGMPFQEYKAAMSYQWVDATEYDKKPVKINVDLTKAMDYEAYVSTLKKLSRYDGVYLYKIGTSTDGRDLYAVEIDVDSNLKKDVIMMTGEIHAREFAGGTYIVKQFVDLVQKAQTDKNTMELLKKNKYVAVPIVNVDGRENLIVSPGKWTTSSGELWKAYSNGTDGGRNFPGLQWGQVAKGYTMKSIIEKSPGYANYPGSHAGSNRETKAMMKWLYHYVVVEKASIYLDMHQQGSIIYAGKSWQTKKQEQNSRDLRTGIMNVINTGLTSRKYIRVYEDGSYGLKGEGSSLTDYAVSLAIGAKFSPAYGFLTFTDGKKEYILMQVKDLDQSKLKIKEANHGFAAVTVETGYGRNYLGNSAEARRLIANEYKFYNFHKLLEALPKII